MRPLPQAERRYEGWSFRTFEEGADALRGARAASTRRPTWRGCRTRRRRACRWRWPSSGSTAERAGKAYLRARGHDGGCLAIVGFEGEADERSSAARAPPAHPAAARRASRWASGPARPGRAGRFAGPYLRDVLLDRGVMVETLETATSWSHLRELYEAVGAALRGALAARGTPPLVMCHVSHLYPYGRLAVLHFVARQEGGPSWSSGGRPRPPPAMRSSPITARSPITTRSARDHVPWMTAEVGELGVELLRAAKERLDPAGIMNPGKLLPPG